MRKTYLVAATATLALGAAGVALAQTTPPPSVTVTTSVSPTKAGTKAKPKSESLKLKVENNAESKTTASRITITFPSTLKLSTKGLDQCRASDETLLESTSSCKKAIAGKGEANALVNPFATTPAPLKFKVTPIVGRNELLFVLNSNIANAVLHGKISGKKLTISIPDFLQQPAPGTYSALIDLSATLSKKKGDAALISSTGCRSKKHGLTFKVDYVPNPSPPSQSSASNTGNAKCS